MRHLYRPRRAPARLGLAGAVALALLTTLLQVLVLSQGPPAVAAMHTYKAVTFNMQNGDRWDEHWRFNGGNLETHILLAENPDIVALQEMGSRAPCGSNFVEKKIVSERIDDTEAPVAWTVFKCISPFAVAKGYDLFFLAIDNGNATRNLGFVVRSGVPFDDATLHDNVRVIGRAMDDNGVLVSGNPKPMLGIKLGDGTWFYTVHGANNGHTNGDPGDTVNRIAAARENAGTNSWAVLGDFNKPKEDWTPADLGGAHVLDSDGNTSEAPLPDPDAPGPPVPDPPKAKNLDYAITSAAPPGDYNGIRLQNVFSDHHAVSFETLPACADGNTVARSTARAPACKKKTAAVSMGDSYISGEGGRWAGNANTTPSGDVWGTDRKADCESGKDCVYGDTSYEGGNRCDRSDVAPIESAAIDGIPRERRFNIACSGAKTEHIISQKYQGEAPQAEQLARLAKDYDVKMVVVSIGGNDLGFSGIITDCVWRFWGWPTGGTCNTSSANAELKGKLDRTRGDVVKALEKIRSVMADAGYARDAYDLVLSTYPNPLPSSAQMRNALPTRYSIGCPFRNTDVDWARNELMPGITSMLRGASDDAGASLLNVENAFNGHELCRQGTKQATSANSRANPLPEADAEWVRWIPYQYDTTKGWLWGSQGDKQEAIHPNAYGQKALGACLTAHARARVPGHARTSTCTGTPGRDSDGVGLERSVRISRFQGFGDTPVMPAGVLKRDKPDSKWVSLEAGDDSDTGRWYVTGDVQVGKTLETTIRNRTGQYLQGDGGKSWQWASVNDTPRVWKIRWFTQIGGHYITTDDGKWCLAVEGFIDAKWGVLRPCGSGGNMLHLWNIENADVKITPRPQPTDRTGPLRSAKDDLVADVDNASPEPGTRVKALAPQDGPAQKWRARSTPEGWQIVSALDGAPVLAHDTEKHEARLAKDNDGDKAQLWQAEDAGDGWTRLRNGGLCLTAAGADTTLTVKGCASDDPGQRWKALGVAPEKPKERSGEITGIGGKCLDVRSGSSENGTPVQIYDCNGSDAQRWTLPGDGTVRALGKCLDVASSGTANGTLTQLWECNGSNAQKWRPGGNEELRNPGSDRCLDVPSGVAENGRQVQIYDCNGSDAQRWKLPDAAPDDGGKDGDAGDPFDDAVDDRGTKPAASGDCRPEGMTPTTGVAARYCDVYDGSGREWVGNNRTRRVIGYFTGWRAGTNGDPKYLVSNIPWSKVTHINYAFAKVENDRIDIGDPGDPKNPATGMTWPGEKNAMDGSLPYKGHFNLLNTYKKKHPAVKTLISVGGWADTRNLYTMSTHADGSVNQAGIDTFADSVTDFLDRYGFNGVDIDFEYPTALPHTGNPKDWEVSNPRRKGLQKGYNALMKTLREKLDKAGTDKGRYYQLTSAGSSSGYLVRGQDAGQALQYQDFVNVMSYDLHGSWNKYVGPQAPLYDDGRDNELADAGIYNDQAANTKDFQKHGYFNTDWAYHYYRGALPPGRINLGIPYYSRGWRDVQGGTDGLWGTAAMPDQSQCPQGTGGRGPANAQFCGLGAVGIDNIWHDKEDGKEVAAGSNPLWHTKNLQAGITPGYLKSYGVDPTSQTGKLTGSYAEKYADSLQAPWLWNSAKKVFLSTENEKSIDTKAKYIADKGIGGAMIWELAGDYTQRPGGEWGMGYDLTTRLDNALKNAGATGSTQAGGRPQPQQVIDVKAELVEFPTGENDFYPVQPKLRITNNTPVTLARGTEISLDIPTSAPPVVKDNDYKEIKELVPGHTGPNAGGLKGDFHRLTLTLGYCEDLAPGKSRDIDLKYYLPLTGPSNITFKIGDKEYGSTGDQRRDVSVVAPPAPATGAACQAADWKQGQVYRPDGGRLWRMYDKGDKGWMFEYGDSPAGKPMMIDNNPDESRVHLVGADDSNPNQYWKFQSAGDGLYSVSSGNRCMTATGSREDIASNTCDGRAQQKWKLVPIADSGSEGAPGSPRHNGLFKLRSAGAGNDIEVAHGATATGTRLLTGDRTASTAAFVKYQGYYWYAQWYAPVAPGTAEANGGKPWKRLSPTP
ncbi:glycosyl hydrolase family 18 protein [Streptomyces sp. NPDC054863]